MIFPLLSKGEMIVPHNVTVITEALISGLNEWQITELTHKALPLAQLLNSVHFILARET